MPPSATTWTDRGTGLSPTTTYAYVVRAVTDTIESANGNERSATTFARPAAPSPVAATPRPAAVINVSWSGVAGVAGYDVYRRTPPAAYDFGSSLNGATLVTAAGYADVAAVHGASYRYVVRAVVAGAGGVPIHSFDSAETPVVTADDIAPTAVTMADPGSPLRGAVTVSGTASDAGLGIAAVRFQYRLGGGSIWTDGCVDSSFPYACGLATPSIADGVYDLRAIAADVAGNVATSATVANRTVDNTAPAGIDVQTTNVAGGTAAKPETQDVLTYTFSEPVLAASILSGWSGAATPVVVRFTDGHPDVLTVYNAANTVQLALGSIDIGKKYVDATMRFTGSTMVLSGSTISIALGTPTGPTEKATGTSRLDWTTSTAATDRAGNPVAGAVVPESGAGDLDF